MGPRNSTIRAVFFGVAMPTAIALMGMLAGCAKFQAMPVTPVDSASQGMLKATVALDHRFLVPMAPEPRGQDVQSAHHSAFTTEDRRFGGLS